MNTRALCAVIACAVAVTGCSTSKNRIWDHPTYQSLLLESPDRPQEEYRDAPDTNDAVPVADAAIDVETAIRMAIENHPRLQASAFTVEATDGRWTQAGLYPNPAFVFSGESLGSDAGEGGETSYLIEQEFLTAGKRKKSLAVAEADRLTAQARFLKTEFAVATGVRIAFTQAIAALARLESERALFALSEQILAAATSRVNAGAATEPDRLRAEVVLEKAAIRLRSAEIAEQTARRQLDVAIGGETAYGGGLLGDIWALPDLPEREIVLARTLAENAQIIEADASIERARGVFELARAEATPNFTASVGPRYSDFSSEMTLDVGIGVEIPVFDRNQGNIRAALSERFAAGASAAAVRLWLTNAVTVAWESYETSRTESSAYRESVLPKAERTFALSQAAYRAGKLDFLRLLDAQQTVVESRIAYIDALERLHESAAALEGLMQSSAPWRQTNTPVEESNQ